jgi:membrane-bound serine protease (ClpP class)
MLLDPNLVYLILIAGLWLSVTAAYVPGTGVVEALALVGVVAALAALATMPTNWWAVILIVVGVLGFLIMPFLDRRFALLAVGGLALQAVGSLTLFDGAMVGLPVVFVTIVGALLYHRFALLPTLEHHRGSPAMLEDEPLTGLHGYVQSALDPVGAVYVRGETWSARSDHRIDAGTEVTVVDQEGLTLFVEPAKHKRQQEEAQTNGN